MNKEKLKEYVSLLVEEQVGQTIGPLYLFKNKVLSMVIREMIISGRQINSDTEYWSLIHDAVSNVKTLLDKVIQDVAMKTPNEEQLNSEEYKNLYKLFDNLLKQEMKGKSLSSPQEILALISDSSGKIKSDLDLTYSLIERDLSTIPYPIFFAKYQNSVR